MFFNLDLLSVQSRSWSDIHRAVVEGCAMPARSRARRAGCNESRAEGMAVQRRNFAAKVVVRMDRF
jgi:hypothetical protein